MKIKVKMWNLKKKVLFFLIWVAVTGPGCDQQYDIPKPDISGIQVGLQLDRFEKDLFAENKQLNEEDVVQLKNKYPVFFPVYMEKIMNFTADADSVHAYLKVLNKFRNNQAIRGLYDTIIYKYPDLSDIKSELETAFRYYKYYLPDKKIPKVVTFLSEFGYGSITYDHIIGIGLDMYLGEDYIYYPSIGLPNYMIERLKKKYIVPNSMKVWGKEIFPLSKEDKRLIDHMIYNGKIFYFLDLTLPDTPDSLKVGYSAEDLQWCYDNEPEIWNYFLKHDLLYLTDQNEFRAYVNIGPTTPGMPSNSPGNVGSWIGWQIVRKYMQMHPKTNFKQLMETDAQKILQLSKYKPKRGIM